MILLGPCPTASSINMNVGGFEGQASCRLAVRFDIRDHVADAGIESVKLPSRSHNPNASRSGS